MLDVMEYDTQVYDVHYTPSMAREGRDENNDPEVEDAVEAYVNECFLKTSSFLKTDNEDGFPNFHVWLGTLDPLSTFYSNEPCLCFFHEYLGQLGMYAVIGYYQISVVNPVDHTNRVVTEIVPKWFTFFQKGLVSIYGADPRVLVSVKQALAFIEEYMSDYLG